jgi:DNA-binding CsgD family transcriptional regulator
MVIVSDPDRDTISDVRILQAIYGLTAVEAKIAALIAAGRSSEEICGQFGYTRQTLAWYSKLILAKTGCRNRAALVRELSTSISSLANACTTGPSR